MFAKSEHWQKLTVSGDLVHSRAKAGKRAKDIGVDLSRVSLTSDGIGVREAEKLSHSLVKGLNLASLPIRRSAEYLLLILIYAP